MATKTTAYDFDVFISHASEDKAAFVTPLAEELRKHGLKVWFDRFTLKVGDSLHQAIEKGLARSRYGVVVFSPNFLAKNWPQAELDGLFARQMDGQKIILPVWHKITSARMKKVLPMLADKVALRSSDGIKVVARSLVEVIRPELLTLDNKQASAFDAGDAFVTEAKRKYPGYDFAIRTGPFKPRDTALSPLSFVSPKGRIEIGISDPELIGRPVGGRVEFFGSGIEKAIQFQQTGKPQKWEPGEFRLADWNVPLMPSHVDGSTLEVGGSNPPIGSSTYMRVEIGSRSPVVFPMMEMHPVRFGTQEAEALLSDKEAALSISLTFAVGSNSLLDLSQEVNTTLSWSTAGKKVEECKKLINAMDGIRRGRVLRIVDIRLGKPIFQASVCLGGMTDPLSVNLRRTLLLASQISEKFSIPLRMPKAISKEDGESLFCLDCLLNGNEYGVIKDSSLRLLKADGELGAAQHAFIKGERSVTYADTPSNYPGYFPLFGQQVTTPDWVRAVEFTPRVPGAHVEKFTSAPLGTEFMIEITATKPAMLRWKEDAPLGNIEIGAMAR